MKTILVPTDFSVNSENTIGYAAEITKLMQAETPDTSVNLILFHVFSVPVPVADVPVAIVPVDEMEKQCLDELKSMEKKLHVDYPSLHTETITRAGFVVEEILLMAEECNADLVIMGVTGSGKSSGVFGSNTTSIMKRAKFPVLALPPDAKFSKPAKIALACDYTATVPGKVTEELKYFIHLFGSSLLVFDVLKPAEVVTYQKAAVEFNLENALSDTQHSLFYPTGSDMEEETTRFIEHNNIGLLVMIPHNYDFIHRLFHRSKSKKVTIHSKIPILSIHE